MTMSSSQSELDTSSIMGQMAARYRERKSMAFAVSNTINQEAYSTKLTDGMEETIHKRAYLDMTDNGDDKADGPAVDPHKGSSDTKTSRSMSDLNRTSYFLKPSMKELIKKFEKRSFTSNQLKESDPSCAERMQSMDFFRGACEIGNLQQPESTGSKKVLQCPLGPPIESVTEMNELCLVPQASCNRGCVAERENLTDAVTGRRASSPEAAKARAEKTLSQFKSFEDAKVSAAASADQGRICMARDSEGMHASELEKMLDNIVPGDGWTSPLQMIMSGVESKTPSPLRTSLRGIGIRGKLNSSNDSKFVVHKKEWGRRYSSRGTSNSIVYSPYSVHEIRSKTKSDSGRSVITTPSNTLQRAEIRRTLNQQEAKQEEREKSASKNDMRSNAMERYMKFLKHTTPRLPSSAAGGKAVMGKSSSRPPTPRKPLNVKKRKVGQIRKTLLNATKASSCAINKLKHVANKEDPHGELRGKATMNKITSKISTTALERYTKFLKHTTPRLPSSAAGGKAVMGKSSSRPPTPRKPLNVNKRKVGQIKKTFLNATKASSCAVVFNKLKQVANKEDPNGEVRGKATMNKIKRKISTTTKTVDSHLKTRLKRQLETKMSAKCKAVTSIKEQCSDPCCGDTGTAVANASTVNILPNSSDIMIQPRRKQSAKSAPRPAASKLPTKILNKKRCPDKRKLHAANATHQASPSNRLSPTSRMLPKDLAEGKVSTRTSPKIQALHVVSDNIKGDSNTPPSISPVSPKKVPDKINSCGIQLEDKIIWKNWHPSFEYSKSLFLKNVTPQTIILSYRPPDTRFFITSFPKPIFLSSGATYEMCIRFRPDENLYYTDRIQFYTKDGKSFPVTLRAVLPTTNINIPVHLDFQSCDVRDSVSINFDVHNSGDLDTSLIWEVALPFIIEPSEAVLPKGRKFQFKASFIPDREFAFEETVVCKFGQEFEFSRPTTFYGIGKFPNLLVSLPGKKVVVANKDKNEMILDFGNVVAGTDVEKCVELINLAPVPRSFTIKWLEGVSHMEKKFKCPITEGLVPEMSTVRLPLSFSARAPNSLSVDYFTIISFGKTNQSPLKCIGCSVELDVQLSKNSILFGNVAEGQSAQKTVELINRSNVEAMFKIDDCLETAFKILDCGGILLPNSSTALSVQFMPQHQKFYFQRVSVCFNNKTAIFLDVLGNCPSQQLKPGIGRRLINMSRYALRFETIAGGVMAMAYCLLKSNTQKKSEKEGNGQSSSYGEYRETKTGDEGSNKLKDQEAWINVDFINTLKLSLCIGFVLFLMNKFYSFLRSYFENPSNPVKRRRLGYPTIQTTIVGNHRGDGTYMPSWVAFDRQVLSFDAYFQEAVHEKTEEQYRVKHCKIYFYLEDDSIQVLEPRLKNAGIPQGTLIRRHRIPRPPPNDDEFYTAEDFNIGAEICLYSKVFKIVDCDQFTQNFLRKMGTNVQRQAQPPEDPYMNYRKAMDDVMSPLRPYEKFDTLKQFLDHDRHVLRFYCHWDDSENLFGDPREMILHYYLADDTIEIREVIPPNSGRDAVPVFLKRGKLPKNPSSLPQPGVVTDRTVLNVFGPSGHGSRYILDNLKTGAVNTEYYTDKDLTLGAVICVWGRKFVLCDCDNFTKEYYKNKYSIEEMTPVMYKRETFVQSSETVPPYNGFGSEEDSLCSTKGLLPKPPKRDFVKFMERDRCGLDSNVLRFLAKMETKKPIDIDRRFIISYFLSDDTILVYEPPVRNSGIAGGRFLERNRIKKPDQMRYSTEPSQYYSATDLFVGAHVDFNSFKFVLIDADEYAFKFMEDNSHIFTKSNIDVILQKIGCRLGANKEDIQAFFARTDPTGSGYIPYEKFREMVLNVEPTLTEQEIMTVAREYSDRRSDIILDTDKLISIIQEELRKKNYEDFSTLVASLRWEDKNCTGYLDRETIRKIFIAQHVPLVEDMLQAALSVAKTAENNNELVLYEDFINSLNWRDRPAPMIQYQPVNADENWCGTKAQNQINNINYMPLLNRIFGNLKDRPEIIP